MCTNCDGLDQNKTIESAKITEEKEKRKGFGELSSQVKKVHKKRKGFHAPSYRRWRRGVFEYYRGCCFLTGNSNREQLRAHHLEGWHKNPDLRYEVSNGVLLEVSVHIKFHNSPYRWVPCFLFRFFILFSCFCFCSKCFFFSLFSFFFLFLTYPPFCSFFT